jgi:hypothetical protein
LVGSADEAGESADVAWEVADVPVVVNDEKKVVVVPVATAQRKSA